MQVLVSGSREGFTYKEFVKEFKATFKGIRIDGITAGGARGIDSYAKVYAVRNGIPFNQMDADWDKHGKKAGSLRNIDMAEHMKSLGCDVHVLALRFDYSSGTTHMIKTAQKYDFKLTVIDKDSVDFYFE